MRRYVLDTNTCIFAIQQNHRVLTAILQKSPESIAVAAMTVAELYFGVKKSKRVATNQAALDAFLAPFPVLEFNLRVAGAYANARLALELQGTPIGERDLIIGSTALANGYAVVTNNMREFERVPGLVVEDWTTGS